ncbi:DUF2029 domain-containing protein [Candidatus Roizmanbacteria bacterium]|nr:DUF2029 domain-containing protein [Candidatus Roizmanbacteria bacterium]
MIRKLLNILLFAYFGYELGRIVWIIFFPWQHIPFDFRIYMNAFADARANQDIYHRYYSDTLFTYPPSIFIFLIPFALVPSVIGAKIWLILSLICLLASFFLLFWQWLPHRALAVQCFIIGLFLQLFPTLNTFEMGQNNIFVLFFCVLALVISQRVKQNSYKLQIAAGVCIGIAGGLKLIPLIILVYFVLKKQWLSMGTAIIIFLAMNFGSIVAGIPLRYSGEYIQIVHQFTAPAIGSWAYKTMAIQYDQSFYSFLTRYFHIDTQIKLTISYLIFVVLIALAVLRWFKKREDGELFSSLLVIGVLIPKTLVWHHHLVLLYPALFFIMYRFFSTRKLLYFILFGFLYFYLYITPFDMEGNLRFFFNSSDVPIFTFHGLFVGLLMLWVFQLKYVPLSPGIIPKYEMEVSPAHR